MLLERPHPRPQTLLGRRRAFLPHEGSWGMGAKACVVIEVLREKIPLFCSRSNFLDELAQKRLLSGL